MHVADTLLVRGICSASSADPAFPCALLTPYSLVVHFSQCTGWDAKTQRLVVTETNLACIW